MMPPVTLIVLNWNAGATLAATLQSLLRLDYPDFRVVVVDNGSDDGSVEMVRDQFPQVTLHQSADNNGFAAGNNLALRQLDTPYAVLVNPDVIVAPDWLRALISAMQTDPTIGIAGCKLYYPEDKLLQHAGGAITLPQALPHHFGLRETDRGQHDTLRDVDYVIGAALAVRRTVIQAIGLLDEGYFLYFEEVDWCARARRAGYRVVYVPQATAVHYESITIKRESDAYVRTIHTSRWRYLLKHFPPALILAETVPAEQSWLDGVGPRYRRLVASAYGAVLRNLPQIWAARVRDGGTNVPLSLQRELTAALRALRRSAWQPPADDAALTAHAMVTERPFTSTLPLLGGLIARLRRAWNNVSTIWYVRALMQQQNQFNQQLLRRLQEFDARLALQEDARLELYADLAQLTAELQRSEAVLASLERRWQALAP